MWELPEKSDRTGNYSGDSVFTDIPGAFTCRPPLGETRHAFISKPGMAGLAAKKSLALPPLLVRMTSPRSSAAPRRRCASAFVMNLIAAWAEANATVCGYLFAA